MFPGKEKFEFGYDILRHSAFCIAHEIVIESSKKFKSVRNIKRKHHAEDNYALKDLIILQ